MPAIATKVKAEKDAFYWHLGDFRWMSKEDEDMTAMQPAGSSLTIDEYHDRAWSDFLDHQMTRSAVFRFFWAGAITRASSP